LRGNPSTTHVRGRGWRPHLFCGGGRLTLLRRFFSSVPNHSLSAFVSIILFPLPAAITLLPTPSTVNKIHNFSNIMNRLLISSLGRRSKFTNTCREFSSASAMLKPYVPSVSSTGLMPTSKSSSAGKNLSGGRLMSSAATAAYDQSIQKAFPSIVIGPDRAIEPQGSFAEAQAQVCLVIFVFVR
jgi:hypothetical protein